MYVEILLKDGSWQLCGGGYYATYESAQAQCDKSLLESMGYIARIRADR